MSTVFRVEKTANYTVMANYHLKDRRLSYKAKGLLSEMLSLPSDWDYTLRGLAVIAADGLDSVRSAVRELEDCGYLVRYQKRDDKGRLSENEFLVYENPEQNPAYDPAGTENTEISGEDIGNIEIGADNTEEPFSETSEADENRVETDIFLDNPLSEKPSTEKPLSENPTTATFNILNTQLLNKQKSNPSINRAPRGNDTIDVIDDFGSKNCVNERTFYRDVIRDNIDYAYFNENQGTPAEKKKLARVDEIVAIMVDVVCSKRETIRVNGEDIPQQIVKQRFLGLDETHIDYVLESLDSTTTEIRNIRAYLITSLYNAPSTIDSYYTAMVNHDMHGV